MLESVKSIIADVKGELTRSEYVTRECDTFERWLSDYRPRAIRHGKDVYYEFEYSDSRADHLLMIIAPGTFDDKKDVIDELDKRGYHNIKYDFRCTHPYLEFTID